MHRIFRLQPSAQAVKVHTIATTWRVAPPSVRLRWVRLAAWLADKGGFQSQAAAKARPLLIIISSSNSHSVDVVLTAIQGLSRLYAILFIGVISGSIIVVLTAI